MNEPVAPDTLPRAVALEGASNVRDLGGWPTAGGGTVAFGRVFRAAALTRLTDADRVSLADIGLRTVCDFRGERERERAPSRLHGLGWLRIYSFPIEPTIGASLSDIPATREATGQDVLDLMHRAYLSYAFDWAHCYRATFDLILEGAERLPLLFHCSAGKDRTGFGAALLLSAVGVGWEFVMADYLASNRLWRSDPELAARLRPVVADKLLRAHGELLEGAFDAVRREFGSVDRYLQAMLDMDVPRRERLRALLVG